MKFRPCIDLHNGKVKQIVGSTIDLNEKKIPVTNFTSQNPSSWYTNLYRKDNLTGGHIIKLGSGNDEAADKALKEWPGGMQIGGGINVDNALSWLEKGASSVIVTSSVFHDGKIDYKNLEALTLKTGQDKLVLDLSCRKKDGKYYIVTDRWQKFTNESISETLLNRLSDFCHEFLIHAVDVEGLMSGIENNLLEIIGNWAKIPITYAGGIQSLEDINLIDKVGKGNIDFTVGSGLDIFGGKVLKYHELAKKYS